MLDEFNMTTNDWMRGSFAWVVTAAVLLTLAVWAEFSARGALPPIIAGMILVFMIPFLKRFNDVIKGMPDADERIKAMERDASAMAFTLSIWWMLALMFYAGNAAENGWPELIPRHVAAAGILGMGILFGISYLHVRIRVGPA